MSLDDSTHVINGEYIVKKYGKRAGFSMAWSIMRGITEHINIPWAEVESNNNNHNNAERGLLAIENTLKNNDSRENGLVSKSSELCSTRTLRIILRRVKLPLADVRPMLRRSTRQRNVVSYTINECSASVSISFVLHLYHLFV